MTSLLRQLSKKIKRTDSSAELWGQSNINYLPTSKEILLINLETSRDYLLAHLFTAKGCHISIKSNISMSAVLNKASRSRLHHFLGHLVSGEKKGSDHIFAPVLLRAFSYLILRQDCEISISIPILTNEENKVHRHN